MAFWRISKKEIPSNGLYKPSHQNITWVSKWAPSVCLWNEERKKDLFSGHQRWTVFTIFQGQSLNPTSITYSKIPVSEFSLSLLIYCSFISLHFRSSVLPLRGFVCNPRKPYFSGTSTLVQSSFTVHIYIYIYLCVWNS